MAAPLRHRTAAGAARDHRGHPHHRGDAGLGRHRCSLRQCRRPRRHHLPGHRPGFRRKGRGGRRRNLRARNSLRRDPAQDRDRTARVSGGAGLMYGWISANPKIFVVALLNHLWLTAVALAAVLLIALPAGVMLTRYRSWAQSAIALANILRTVPSLALLVLMLPVLGTGFLPSVVALTLYGLPALLLNTYTGMIEVEPDIVDAARGQGFSDRQVMTRIEIPLALPVVFAGVRTAAVQIVSAATLAAFIGGGGLGELITSGMANFNFPQLVAGALAVALLALAVELV